MNYLQRYNQSRREMLQREEEERIKNNQLDLLNEQQNNHIENRFANKMCNLNKKRDFFDNIEKTLLSEALFMVLNKSINSVYENAETLERHLVNSFVEEQGSYKLLNRMCGTSYVLSEFVRNVKEYQKSILEKAEETNVYEIDDQERESFYNDIDTEDINELIDAIRQRITMAITTSEAENESTRKELEASMELSREKLNSTVKDSIKEEVIKLQRKRDRDIRDSDKCVFSKMVLNIMESSFKDPDMKVQFFNEQSMPDMTRILEHTKILYGFLEMVVTAKLIDERDILEFISSNVDSLKI